MPLVGIARMFKGLRPTYRDQTEVLNSISQEQVFYEYLGIYPDLGKSYLSPFRTDRKPGCRFKWHSGILYFVENSMFQNKLYWSCFDVVMYTKHCSFQEALDILYLKTHSLGTVNKVSTNVFTPDIRFEKKPWGENMFMLSGDVLEKELVFNVKNYWIKTKAGWLKNSIHDPNKTLVVAYYFPETNHTKLYFPEKIENRWYSNCSIQDIFGYNKVDYYKTYSDTLWITKSAKDRLMLDYFIGVPSIALQNEGCHLPDPILEELKSKFKNLVFLYDNDLSGINQAQKLSEKYDIPYKIIDVTPKDTYEMIEQFGIENTKKLIL